MGEQKRKAMAISSGAVEACANCRFFQPIESTRGGFCRKRAPIVLFVGIGQDPISNRQLPVVNSYHPQMPSTGWCGEHERDLTKLDLASIDLGKLADEGVEGTA